MVRYRTLQEDEMKTGKTLQELAAELDRQSKSKKDLLAPTSRVEMVAAEKRTLIRVGDVTLDGVRKEAHDQIAQHTKIPQQYYNRMQQEAPALLANNVNTWFQKFPAVRLLRGMDNQLRAFLSDGYRPLENYDLAEAVFPVLSDIGVQVLSCDVTDQHLYIKGVDMKVARELEVKGLGLGKGHQHFDKLCPAIVIRNSEIGFGALAVETSVWTEGCTNLVVMRERSMRRRHIGAKGDLEGEDIYRVLSDQTRRVTDAALWLKVRDVVKAAFNEARFDALCDELRQTTEQRIEGDPVKVVEFTAHKFALNEQERGGVLNHLIRGGDFTRYGLYNAVTRAAEDVGNYDRASELEALGGKIIDLPQTQWKTISEADDAAIKAVLGNKRRQELADAA